MIDFLMLRQNLKERFYPLLIVKGKDEWVKLRAIKYISQSLDMENIDMNIHHVDGGKIDDLLMICNTQPFFSSQKLVIVHNMEYGSGANLSRTVSMLNEYIDTSDNSCCLVLCIDNENKSLDKVKAETINCNKLSEDNVAKWIMATVKSYDRDIDKATALMISQYCLADMGRVASEVDKLCMHATNTIDADMVELLVTKDTEYLTIDLAGVIANKNTAKALDMLKQIFRRGEDARRIFGMLYKYYRRMYYVRISKSDRDTLASQLDVKAGAIGFSQRSAEKYSPRQLLSALKLFGEADAKLKAFANEMDTMQLLVLQLVAL